MERLVVAADRFGLRPTGCNGQPHGGVWVKREHGRVRSVHGQAGNPEDEWST